jgi:pyruvate kinase
MASSTQVARRLTLGWGLHSIVVPQIASVDEMSVHACKTAVEEGFASKGDTVVMAAGTPTGVSGSTNTLKILTV